ncbi:MAG TPA: hypothetical protein EYG21_06510 [Nitrospinaceae bacterium]|nr:hypothetical protein [Nitrospinaceae bacterium]
MDTSLRWIPEIVYEEADDGLTSNIPFISVPPGQAMPKILFIFESSETGEFEPGPEGEELPVTEIDLHQYADMNTLRDTLSSTLYNEVRVCLGLEPLDVAVKKGQEITEKIRTNLR